MKQPETKQEKKQYEPPFLTDIHPVSIVRGEPNDSNINFDNSGD
jgi:hypothetical protein